MARHFPYHYDLRLAPFWAPFGARPGHGGVELTDDGRFVAKLGWARIETPLANVGDAHVTRGYRWWTSAGARMSLKDDGLTFGTNSDAGTCVHFVERVRSPFARRGHSALTVTVDDPDGLVEALAAAGR